MQTKRLTRNALLSGVALIIFIIELNIPALSPVPGLKLGLSNIITVYAIFVLGPKDALEILTVRILLGTFLSGNLSALMYSAAGGLMCYMTMLGLSHVLAQKQMWIASVLGAIAHNFGQILIAIAITKTPSLFAYFPIMTAGGMIAGLFTGLCGQYMAQRLGHSNKSC